MPPTLRHLPRQIQALSPHIERIATPQASELEPACD
jgi:hypothetical protein